MLYSAHTKKKTQIDMLCLYTVYLWICRAV